MYTLHPMIEQSVWGVEFELHDLHLIAMRIWTLHPQLDRFRETGNPVDYEREHLKRKLEQRAP